MKIEERIGIGDAMKEHEEETLKRSEEEVVERSGREGAMRADLRREEAAIGEGERSNNPRRKTRTLCVCFSGFCTNYYFANKEKKKE